MSRISLRLSLSCPQKCFGYFSVLTLHRYAQNTWKKAVQEQYNPQPELFKCPVSMYFHIVCTVCGGSVVLRGCSHYDSFFTEQRHME